MQKIISLKGNSIKLDGGAMFGNAPKAMWSKWLIPDELNLIPMSCRSLLVQEENKNVLFDVGPGVFFPPKLQERYGIIETSHVLLDELNKIGLTDADIDIIVLSHLHFDHCGGLLSKWEENQPLRLLFPNAKFLVSKSGWERANNPHPRDHASFPEVVLSMMEKSGQLVLVDDTKHDLLGENYRFIFSNGHTPGLLCTEIKTAEGPLIYVSDLIPGTPWLHLPITTAYDRAAEEVVDEKRLLLNYVLETNARLFYVHDYETAMSNVMIDSKGRFCATN